ncbi:DUF4870 domain-containing protein [Pseudonocardia spinosispora]|uniref:DUF4870 domain-containing protein n=1 Tax=Pseudonocardia spinosispora TaxID=103441 RepID=UPI00055F24AF|nr:DUF4870 domain-containing protein [Pseudonocardia spinosispora]
MSTGDAPRPYQGPVGAGVSQDDRNWAMGAHLSAIVGAWIFLGLVGPLLVLVIRGDRSPFVRAHSVEALNFNISVLIYSIIGGLLLWLVGLGFLIWAVVGILWLVCTILGTVKANKGEYYRYPLTIRLVT